MFIFDENDIEPDEPEEGDESEEQEEEEAKEPVAAAAEPSKFDRILDWAGADEEADTTLLEQITEDGVKNLPPEARVVLKQVRAAARNEREKAQAAIAEREARATAREAELERKGREVLESRAQLGRLFDTDSIRAMVAQSKLKRPDEIDVSTSEGMKEFLELQAAKTLGTFTEPIRRDAEEARRQAAKQSILDQYAEDFKQTGFKAEVETAITADMDRARTLAQAAGRDPEEAAAAAVAGGLERYIKDVKLRRMVAAEENRRVARRRAAQASADNVHKSRGSDSAAEEMEPPKDIERQGGSAVIEWYKAHPRAYEKFKREHRIGA